MRFDLFLIEIVQHVISCIGNLVMHSIQHSQCACDYGGRCTCALLSLVKRERVAGVVVTGMEAANNTVNVANLIEDFRLDTVR